MPRPTGSQSAPTLLAVLAAICAIAITASGCGSDDEQFTSGEAERALAALDSIQQNVDDGRCETARRRVNTLVTQAAHINEDRPELGNAYAESVARLQELLERECVEIMPTSPTAAVQEPTKSTGGKDVTPTGDGGASPTPETPKPEVPNDGGNQGGGDNGGGQPGDDGQEQTPPPEDSGGAGPGT